MRAIRTVLGVLCVLAIALVGWMDYLTGPWLSFALLYVAPVLAASWWLGRGPALASGLAAGICWFVAEAWGHRGEPTRALMWNSGSRLIMLLAMGAMTVRIREDQTRLRGANRRLADLLGDAERLLERIQRLAKVYPGMDLGASIGMALYPTPPAAPEEMVRAADAAMYEAKQRGKGQVVLWQSPAAALASAKA